MYVFFYVTYYILLSYVSCLLTDTSFEHGSIFLTKTGAFAMKPGGGEFALNPHATSYVPLYKRVDHVDMEMSFAGVQVTVPKNSSEVAYKLIRDDDDLDMEMEIMEMEIDMDIEYLLVTFSGLSQESITDVYLANSGDLEATIEMLNQLEVDSLLISPISFTCNIIGPCHIFFSFF